MATIPLDNSLGKNHIVFRHNNNYYSKNIIGDDIDNVFKENFMNTYLEQFEERIGKVSYNDIVFISVLSNYDNIIQNLPNNLIGLLIMSSICTEIILSEQVKRTITNIHIDNTNINTFPNIDGCNNLKQLKIMHSNIETFIINYDLPQSLIELNLSGNMLKNNGFSYEKLEKMIKNNRFCKINLNNNHLNYDLFPEKVASRCNIIIQGTYKHYRKNARNVNYNNVRNIVHNVMDHDQINNVAPTDLILSSQSVHLSSINTSINKSIKEIIEYINENYLIVENIDITNISHELNYFINKYCLKGFEKIDFLGGIYLSCNTLNSITNMTYKQTFEIIWCVMNHLISINKFEKNDLYEILAEQIKESDGYCFTGRYNRLVNSLVGILDGVQIGISEKEEIQIKMQRILKRINKSKSPSEFSDIICEAREMLKMNDDKEIWISSLLDYSPEPTKIFIENDGVTNEYLLTWDDLILCKNTNEDNIIVGTLVDGKFIFI